MEEKPTGSTGQVDPNDFHEEGKEENTATHTDNVSGKSDENSSSEPESSNKSVEETDKEKEEQAKKNAFYAEQRRKKEAEEKAKKEAEQKEREQKIRDEATLSAKLGMLKTNPYTNEPIVDAEDLQIYEVQKKLEEEGKDPISDLPKRLAEINRKHNADAKKQQEQSVKKQEQINAEIKELLDKYPDVKTDELARDPLFQECLTGRAGRWSQVEIYELYLDKKAKAEAEEKEKQKKQVAENNSKNLSSTPTSQAGGKPSAKNIEDMSAEEYAEYFNKKYGG